MRCTTFQPRLELAPDVREISPIESDNGVTFEFNMESPSPHSARRKATVFNGLNIADTFCIVAPAWCRMKFTGKPVEEDDSMPASWITEFRSRLSHVAGFEKPVQMLWFTYDGQRFFGQDSYGPFSGGLQADTDDNSERVSQERLFALTSIGEYLASHCREIDRYLPRPASETPKGKIGGTSSHLQQLGKFGEIEEESAWQKLEPLLLLARYHQLAEVRKCGLTEAIEDYATGLSADLTGLFSARLNRRFVWRPSTSIDAITQSAPDVDIIADLILDVCQNYRELSAPVAEMVSKAKSRKVLENLLWHALYNDLADLGFLLSAIIKRNLVVSDEDRFQPEFATTAYKLTRAEFQPAPLLEDARSNWFSELGVSGEEPGTEASNPSRALEEFNGKSLGEVRKKVETRGVVRRQVHMELSRLRSAIDGNPVFWGLALSMGEVPERSARQSSVVSLAHRYVSPLAQQFINTTFNEAAIPPDRIAIGVASHLLEKIDRPSQKFSKSFMEIFGGLHQSVSEHLDISIAGITTQFALGPGLIRSEFKDYHDFILNEFKESSNGYQDFSSNLQKAGKPLIKALAELCLPRRGERFDRWSETSKDRSPLQQFCDAASLQLLVRHMRGVFSDILENYPREIPGDVDRNQIAYALRQLFNFPGKTNWQFREFLNLVTELQKLTKTE